MMKSCAFAAFAAASTLSRVASVSGSKPYPMLPPMLWLNICMSCATSPMCLCVLARFSERTSLPSSKIAPDLTS